MIGYGKQEISQSDIDSVNDVLKSDFLTQGPTVPIFEKKISEYVGSKFAVAVNSATSALHIGCMSLGIEKGDIVWTSSISFVASANCAIYCGAKVDFLDVNPIDANICIENLKNKLFTAKKENKLPKAIIVVHFAGASSNMKEIYDAVNPLGIRILEDASHALGASFKKNKIGSCNFSDIAVFSFHPVKMITTGEGGMLLTNNKNIYAKAQSLRTHGIVRNNFQYRKKDSPWYYEQQDLGFNYRMNDIQAALGISQLTKLDNFVKKRRQIAKTYDDFFTKNNINFLRPNNYTNSSYHLYCILVKKGIRKKLFNFLRSKDIGVNVHYIPIYRHPFYKKMGFIERDFPNSENYYQRTISIPIFTQMKREIQSYVVNTIIEGIKKFDSDHSF